MGSQASKYSEAPFTATDSVYGSTFFITGVMLEHAVSKCLKSQSEAKNVCKLIRLASATWLTSLLPAATPARTANIVMLTDEGRPPNTFARKNGISGIVLTKRGKVYFNETKAGQAPPPVHVTASPPWVQVVFQ